MVEPLAGKVMHASDAVAMAATLATVTAEVIVERLSPWLRHEPRCAWISDSECTCGLSDALAALGEASR